MEISQYRLAQDINEPAWRINEIVLGKRSITADTALRLSVYFGFSEKFWLNLQMRYNLEIEKDRPKDRLKKEVKRLQKANWSTENKISKAQAR
jgi:addiction module HigA family antidote